MRLITKDTELLAILRILLTEISSALKQGKCLVFLPDNIQLPEDEIKKKNDFSFKPEIQDIPITECFKRLGVILYHLAYGRSKHNRESYRLDGYLKPLDSALWPAIKLLLSGTVKEPKQVRKLLNLKQPEKQKQAQNPDNPIQLMGNNCFLSSDWQTHYNIQIPEPRLIDKEILLGPCPIEKDKQIKDTHFLFYAPENTFSLLDWRDKYPEKGQPRFYGNYSDRWYNDQFFAKNIKNRYSLYLGYKKVLPNSTNKSYQDQLSLLPQNYEPFLAVELAMFLILYYKKNQEYLYESIFGRCQDSDFDRLRVYLGYFNSNGLGVGRDSDDLCLFILGVSALRKLF